jgi:hypothetical protein
MKRTADDAVIAVLLRQLQRAFDVGSWHGTNLLGSLRGLEPATVVWRPQPDRHNIAELAVHAAYWKYRVVRLLLSDAFPSFELKGSDFFPRDDVPTPAAWRADLDRLRAWHRRLLDAVQGFPLNRLEERTSGGRFTFTELICGAAAHDLYHAGQIQLIKRMHGAITT